MIRLGVNIDHVATLRNARNTRYPNPTAAAALVEKAGGEQITVHLREDRRHIQDEDLVALRKTVSTLLNLEMAATSEMQKIACEVKPDTVTLVPERREELTTEGGLDVVGGEKHLKDFTAKLKNAGIQVSFFIEPDVKQIDAVIRLDGNAVELHTGRYCELTNKEAVKAELARLREAAKYAQEKGLHVVAGHGLNYDNIEDILRFVPEIREYNIGHSIISRSLFIGLEQAVKEMQEIFEGAGK